MVQYDDYRTAMAAQFHEETPRVEMEPDVSNFIVKFQDQALSPADAFD
jgi:hypothetical protein